MAVQPRGGRSRSPGRLGQHSLRSHNLAATLVAEADVSSSDLVIEVGAGNGILTKALVARARQVIAVELDPTLAVRLIEGFLRHENALVVAGDFFRMPLPAEPYRVFGNIPFGRTTSLLRHLLEPGQTGMERADLIVERGAAMKRSRVRRGNLLNLGWAPWWRFTMGAQLPARAFSPRPSVDAAMLTIERRAQPLLEVEEWPAYIEFLRATWSGAQIGETIRPFLSRRRFKPLAHELGVSPSSPPTELGLHQWVGLFHGLRADSKLVPPDASHL